MLITDDCCKGRGNQKKKSFPLPRIISSGSVEPKSEAGSTGQPSASQTTTRYQGGDQSQSPQAEQNQTSPQAEQNQISPQAETKNTTANLDSEGPKIKVTARRKTSAYSIKEQLHEKNLANEEKPKIDKNSLPKDAFEIADLEEDWKKFVDNFQSEGALSLYNALLGYQLKKVSENVILVRLVSEAQKKQLISKLPEFLEPIHKKLNNYHIQFKVDFIPEEEQKQKMYTQDDVYRYLLEKYPDLKGMIDELGLDLSS